MNTTDTTFTQWRKSSHSGGEAGQCVEVAHAPAQVGIRDSKNPTGGLLAVNPSAFAGLLARVKTGDLDL